MAYIGKIPAAAALTADDISDGIISNAKLAQDIISAETALGAEPADTDELLVSDAGTLKRMDYSHIKGGGLSVADQWRITSNFSISGTSLANLTSNFERVDTGGQGVIGAMSESSGVFTFPSTGFYLVMADWSLSLDDNVAWINVAIQATTDNSSYAEVAQTNAYITRTNSVNTYTSSHINTLLDVTNTTNVKVKFAAGRESNTPVARGNTNYNYTYFTFLRLGDT